MADYRHNYQDTPSYTHDGVKKSHCQHGNFTLWRNLTIDAGKTLNIPSGGTLTIGEFTLQNNGTINVESGGAISGTVSGNQPNQ